MELFAIGSWDVCRAVIFLTAAFSKCDYGCFMLMHRAFSMFVIYMLFFRSTHPSARPKWRGAFDDHHHLIQSIKDISLNAFQFPASVFTAFMIHIRRGRDALDGFCWSFSHKAYAPITIFLGLRRIHSNFL